MPSCPSPRLPLLAILVATTSLVASESRNPPVGRPNILFIAVDDLRPEFGAYGASHIKAPNLDRLANQAVRFDRAYCMVATCGASRASLMTSVRPTAKRFLTHDVRASVDAPWAVPMNTHFKALGYHTQSLGKVYHHADDHENGWSEPAWSIPRNLPGANPGAPSVKRGAPATMLDVDDDACADGALAGKAVAALRERAARPDQPFFMAVGFHKPHLPFAAPKSYWDLYPPETIRLPDNYHRPEQAPDDAIHNWGELRQYEGIPREGPLPEEQARHLIRGYYACVSFVDAQIGKVLDELDRLGLTDSTIVVLWGDHGWNLGDHTLWCKHSTFESSMRIPLLVRAPGIRGGTHTVGLTESIDLYPTLCELAGVPVPPTVEGKSLVPLLRFPHRPWVEAAAGRFGRGDTIRTDRYRYTEYRDPQGAFRSRMLYDHVTDALENHNIAAHPAMAATVAELSRRLREVAGSTAHPSPPSPNH